jgi:undecaprenyl-diphosphatase
VLDVVFEAITWASVAGALWLALALALAVLRGRRGTLLLTAIAIALADGVAQLLQGVVGRRRPPLVTSAIEPLIRVPDAGSFPSGHASTSFAAATVLALILPRFGVPLLLLAAAVAYSRLYVGVHYPLDSLGGLAVGVTCGLLVHTVARRKAPWLLVAGPLRRPRPQVPPG